jgi:gliding motility-associated-like protein
VPGTFSANPAGLNFGSVSTGEINLSTSMEGTYTITNTIPGTPNCPAATATATVVLIQAPTAANAGSPQTICGNTGNLTANNPVFGNGTWTLVSGSGNIMSPNSASTEIRNLAVGPNVFQWTTQSNPPCPSSSATVTITSIPKPEVTNLPNETICSGGTTSITLTANIPSVFTWSATDNPNTTGESTTVNSGNVISNTIFNQSNTDQLVSYSVTPVSVNGNCAGDSRDITVLVLNPPRINAGRDTIALLNQPHQLLATGGNSYVWSPASPLNNAFIANPLAALASDTRFIVEGSNAIGCKGYDTVFIKVYQGPTYYIPNAFSPNGDGLNDIFTPIPVGIVSTDWFRVYNRYGQLVFESNEWLKGWDGRFRGERQPTGAYIWMIKGKTITGKEISAKGSVLLIH